MTGQQKKFIILSGSVVSFVLIVAAFLFLFINADANRKRVERMVSASTGFDLAINGRIGLVLFPRFGISAGKVQVAKEGVHILSAEKIRVGLELLPLLRSIVSITEIAVVEPRVTIERDAQGRFSSLQQGHKKGQDTIRFPVPVSMGRFNISGGNILFIDRRSDTAIELSGFDLAMTGISLGTDKHPGFARNVSFAGSGRCAVFTREGYRAENIAFSVKAGDGIVDIQPISMDFFGTRGNGAVQADLTGMNPSLNIRFSASQFSFDEVQAAFSKRQVMKGRMDLALDMVTEGKSLEEMKRKANGTVSVHGEDLILDGLDIDGLIADVEDSRSITVADLAAFSLVGPLGLALTKGSDLANVYMETQGGRGAIGRLSSAWIIQNGIASAKDVAFATAKNRVAVKGRLDLINSRFDEIIIAVLDERGCPRFSQMIRGRFVIQKSTRSAFSPL